MHRCKKIYIVFIYTDCVKADPKVFQTSREFTYVNVIFSMFLFMSLPILYVCEYQAQKLCESCMCILLCLLYQKYSVRTVIYVPPIRACMRVTCMNPDVEFTVSKTVFNEILITLGINYNKKRIVYKALILI